jgi:hypothetical protein
LLRASKNALQSPANGISPAVLIIATEVVGIEGIASIPAVASVTTAVSVAEPISISAPVTIVAASISIAAKSSTAECSAAEPTSAEPPTVSQRFVVGEHQSAAKERNDVATFFLMTFSPVATAEREGVQADVQETKRGVILFRKCQDAALFWM